MHQGRLPFVLLRENELKTLLHYEIKKAAQNAV
jgi:hypothetical protein